MTPQQLTQFERRLADIERTQKQLLMPKSKPRIIVGGDVSLLPPLVEVTFTSNSHDWSAGDAARGFTADQVTPITFTGAEAIGEFPVGSTLGTITIENPNNFNWLSGDKAICRKYDAETYYVVKVLRAVCTRFRFKLTANAPNGLTPNLTATALSPVNGESGAPPSGSLTIKDIFSLAHNAKTDHKGVAEYDYNNGWWYATECEHICTRFIGTLYSSLSGGSSTMQVVPVTALNGKSLPSYTTSLTVYNTYNWESGTTGHKIAAEWNPVDGRWEAYQMRYECEE